MILKKIVLFIFCALGFAIGFINTVFAQQRERVVKTVSSQPANLPPAAAPLRTSDKTKSLNSSQPANRPALTNNIVVQPPLVKKTVASAPANPAAALAAGKMVYNSAASDLIMRGILARLGIPYRYGSTGPNRFDCSGFVWSVFNDAGINYVRSSARWLWSTSMPVAGDERYKFGTLVFFNRLGHVGIVADENGFYHASSSKGITYSPFKGYWEKRIVGFRKFVQPAPQIAQAK